MAVKVKTRSGNTLTPRTGYNPKTGAAPEMRPTPNVLSDAADTSRDAQRLVSQPPAPFQNPFGSVNVPAPTNARGSWREDSLDGSRGRRVGCANTSLSDEEMAAIGYGPNDTKSNSPIISGQPLRNNARRAGEIILPKGKGRR
jgi:hypothetical protein